MNKKMSSITTMRAPTWVSTRRQLEQLLTDLHKCTNISHIKQIQTQLYKTNQHQDLFFAPKLITAFSLSHNLPFAVSFFNQIEYPNVHLYNTLLKAYVHNSQPSLALLTFNNVLKDGIFPDNFTYPFLVKGFSGRNSLYIVKMLHAHVEKFGFFSDIYVPNSFIDGYCKCGEDGVLCAKRLFGEMNVRDVVSWNSMIGGLVRGGELSEACRLFDEMPERDLVSWNTVLNGYVKAGDVDGACEVFERMPKRSVVSWTTMVSGYVKAGELERARVLFDTMPVRNLVTWTIMIAGYAEKGMAKEAVLLYSDLESAGVKVDDAAIVSILAACAQSGLLTVGERVHGHMKSCGYRCSVAVANALVDMYAKCGEVKTALCFFEGMKKRDLVSWNAVIQGLAVNGHGDIALEMFSRMKQEGFRPDEYTFIGVLCACTHMGFVDRGLEYFYAMERDHGIVPAIEHYGCVVDLLGRGGRLKEALKVVHDMPFEPNVVIWGSLLGACRMHNAVELAAEVVKHLSELDPTNSGNFSMLSNIYAAAGDWANVANMRLSIKSSGAQKQSGASSIELDGDVYEFTVFDNSHPEANFIYQMVHLLRQHLKKADAVPMIAHG